MYLAHSHVWRRLEVPFDTHKENRRNYTTRLWRIFHVKCGLAGLSLSIRLVCVAEEEEEDGALPRGGESSNPKKAI